jgi:hypothetical protein
MKLIIRQMPKMRSKKKHGNQAWLCNLPKDSINLFSSDDFL